MRIFLFVLLMLQVPVVSACAKTVAAPAQIRQIEPNSPLKIVSPSSLQQSPAMNGITRVAADAGVRTCLPRIEQTGNFITANTESKALLFLPPADADRQITSASYEVKLPDNVIAYASMSAAPTIDGGCDSLYETVTYRADSCADVARKGFPDARPAGVLQQHIMVLQGNANYKVFLMPVGPQGCVAIKKEVLF